MTVSRKPSLAVLVLASALAGVATPAMAGNPYYPGLERHNRPDTRSQTQLVPRLTPAPTIDIAPTGSIEGQRIYSPGVLRERYKGGDHDYYRGIIAPKP
ncbi:hypothetical protein PZN02_004564 [Sinorhizobium garamanticum]|uniref:Transmembrane protein n=1 Tax=Sinorhizobium garamanticum TaxID=680247 RepID=A0ABY8DJ93_9HYPH|nr:hypothetical protein [Sinorhizobium garamanticum]WEX90976.1 hypothetical protein PZN02_004564 [Sinorhizobium garamanticum]